MSDGSLRLAPRTPGLFARLVDAAGLHPFLAGAVLLLATVAVLLLQELVLGRLAAGHPKAADIRRELWVAVVHVIVASYVLSAYVYAERSCARTVAGLWPQLDEERATPIVASTPGRRMALGVAGLFGLLFNAFVIRVLSPGEVTLLPSDWSPETGWHRVFAFVIAFWVSRFLMLLLLDAGRLSALAGTIRELDLLDPKAVAPFSRQGLSNALLIVGLVSILTLFLSGSLAYLPMVVAVGSFTAVMAPLALLLPMRGARRRIMEAKAAELAWCRRRMHEARERLAAGGPSGIDELVAWEARIEAVREWPIDTGGTTRFVLYLLIPLGSWAGGAVVERLVDAVLD